MNQGFRPKISWFWSEFESSIYIIWYFSTAVNAQTLRSQVPQFEIGSISRRWNTYFECLIYPYLFDIRVQIWRFPFGDVQLFFSWTPHFWRNHRNGKVHVLLNHQPGEFPIRISVHPMGHCSAIYSKVSIWTIRHWSTSEPRWAVCACGSWNSHIPRAPRSLGWTWLRDFARLKHRTRSCVSLRKNMWTAGKTWMIIRA